MLLVFDVGNTNIAVGAYESGALAARWQLHTSPQRTTDEYGTAIRELLTAHALDTTGIDGAAIACVVPAAETPLVEMCRKYLHCEPLVITAETDLGLKVFYEPVRSLGADRIVNSFAAAQKYGLPVIVVDLGTATKFEAVSADGEYLGGAILPGVGISLEAMAAKAAKLPRIDLSKAEGAIARDTVGAISAGIIYGTAGAVDSIVKRIKTEMGTPAPKVIATGGYAYVLCGISAEAQIFDSQLTLDGLYLAHQRIMRDCCS